MHSTAKLFAALLLLAGSRLALAVNPSADIDALVHSAAAEVMQQHQIPGLAIAITAQGQQRFYNYGVASRQTGQPISSDTLFEIGSISKTFTATLATYAQAKGQLSLDDKVGKYLPELQGSPFAEVTLINLATHTAGGFPLQVPDAVHNTAQLMDYLKAWQPQYPAGSQRTYANPSIGMLGVIVARSLHVPYAHALEQQLFPALAMPNSYLQVPANKQALYAQGYSKDDAPVRLNPGVLAAEAYGVKTSARDLLHFVEAQLGQAELEPALKQALSATRTGYFTLGAMTQDLIWEQYNYPIALDALLQGNSSQMAYQSHAVSALQPPLPAQDAVWVNKTGSTNGFGAYVAFVPAKQIGIVLLANRNYPNEDRVRLAYRILSALE
ncbi:class C beta-lactamase [Aquipseudomonas ullengensis]|uniref:Beta-lactamase n=1 Tax=Aquipseudomonas ullengensis TaxID=2759166 RepID=A0A7W4LKG0_9GAMM|nr:class C beta-lactamase [Pseudomonas ullengensis]MBB2494796.1 beta-lactamase [Pseudomonas ullengensis]